MSRPSPGVLEDAAHRIEGWLLHAGVQVDRGDHRGGIAGWLDRERRPAFVYLEITGYYLTALAWLIAGAPGGRERADILARGRRALDWLSSATAEGALPPTRLHLAPAATDWRNAAVFSFDLAMVARGVHCFAATAAAGGAERIVASITGRLLELARGSAVLPSHAPANGGQTALPDRWSTRPGPHHLKAAAALLRLPPGLLPEALAASCRATVTHWSGALESGWPCPELHPLLYGLEGLVMSPSPDDGHDLGMVERLYTRLMELQAPDGTLPAVAGSMDSGVRADVLAQALRLGAILRAEGGLAGDDWSRRLDALAVRLLEHVAPDGGVRFSLDAPMANAWCAMFAHQALVVDAERRRGRPLPVAAVELLI